MMKLITAAFVFLALIMKSHAQSAAAIPLWPQGAPGALGQAETDVPTLTPFLPPEGKASGAAIVVCPGGGYAKLAPHEGNDYALFLNQQGVAAFVLKYRLGSNGYRHPAMMNDVQRAIRLVRARAGEWKVDPRRVGVMGSSAGGHLASTAATHFDAGKPDAADPVERQSCRPDLAILCYAVISMGPIGHAGSRANLLGDAPSAELVKLLSNELQVTKETPPCFVWSTYEDKTVPVENSLEFAAALRRAGVPCDLHVYNMGDTQKGRHGLGLAAKPPGFENAHRWSQAMVAWLKVQGFVK